MCSRSGCKAAKFASGCEPDRENVATRSPRSKNRSTNARPKPREPPEMIDVWGIGSRIDCCKKATCFGMRLPAWDRPIRVLGGGKLYRLGL